MAKIITCKTCGEEIAANAKVCPKCGAKNKKPFYKTIWFWVVIFVLIIIIASAGNGSDNSTSSSSTPTQKQEKVEEKIEYTTYSVKELSKDLDANALKASDKYKDQYVEITGRLSNIDASGKYIDIVNPDDEWAILGVQCYIKNDEQKAQVIEMNINDTVTVQGKITDVGEVMGYSLNIDSIIME